MDQATHNKIVSFIWGIADDVLRDLFKRGKYPDVILPMCVIRRMDAVLEPTKKKVLETKKMLDEARITEQRAALCDAAGQALRRVSLVADGGDGGDHYERDRIPAGGRRVRVSAGQAPAVPGHAGAPAARSVPRWQPARTAG